MRVDCDERPDIDLPLQRRAGRAASSWPVVAIVDSSGLRANGRHASQSAHAARAFGGAAERTAAAGAAAAVGDRRPGARRHRCGVGSPPRRLRAAAQARRGRRCSTSCSPSIRRRRCRRSTVSSQGGIHDQLGGGFHADSTDERWVVPHFEKRAADQAALLVTFARAAALTGQPRYAAVARRLIAYVECRLALDGGGYAASEDADVGPYDDGIASTPGRVDGGARRPRRRRARRRRSPTSISTAAASCTPIRRATSCSSPPRPRRWRASSVARSARCARLIGSARDKLLAARGERPQPAVDATPYAGVFARMARAYLEAEAALGVVQERERALCHPRAALRRARRRRRHSPSPRRRAVRCAGSPITPSSAWRRCAPTKRPAERSHLLVARATADHLLERFWHAARRLRLAAWRRRSSVPRRRRGRRAQRQRRRWRSSTRPGHAHRRSALRRTRPRAGRGAAAARRAAPASMAPDLFTCAVSPPSDNKATCRLHRAS